MAFLNYSSTTSENIRDPEVAFDLLHAQQLNNSADFHDALADVDYLSSNRNFGWGVPDPLASLLGNASVHGGASGSFLKSAQPQEQDRALNPLDTVIDATSTPDASTPIQTSPARKSPQVARVGVASSSSSSSSSSSQPVLGSRLTATRPPFCQSRPLMAQTPSPPFSEVPSPPSSRDFNTPSPLSSVGSEAGGNDEDEEGETDEDGEMEDNDAEGETDEDADDMESDEDSDAESDSDFEPTGTPRSSNARVTIPLPHRRNAPAAAPSTISLQARDDDEYEGEETSEPEDDDDDDKDGDYGVRARPSRSAPPAKRRRDNAGAAIAVPKRRVAGVKKGVAKKKTETQLEYEILPADTVQPTARKAADGLYHCSVAGCPKSYKEPSGLSHHWSVHIPKKIPCPACGRKFDKNRKTSIERHLQSQKGCPASKAEKEEGLKELVTSMKKRSNA